MSKARTDIFAIVTASAPTSYPDVARAASRFDTLWESVLLETPYGLSSPFYTFAHFVLDDCNFDDNAIDFCLSRERAWRTERLEDVRKVDLRDPDPSASLMDWGGQFLNDYADSIVEFLQWLKTLPADIRETP